MCSILQTDCRLFRRPVQPTNIPIQIWGRVAFVLMLAILASPLTGSAQTHSDSTRQRESSLGIGSMPVDQLLAESKEILKLFSDLQAGRAPLLDEYRVQETALERLAVERQSIELPIPPDTDHPPVELSEAQALADRWTRRGEAAEQIQATLAERLSRLSELRSTALRLAQETELLRQAAAVAIPMTEEISRRYTAGEIEVEIAQELIVSIPAGTSAAGLAEEVDAWRSRARRAAFEAENAEADQAAVAESVVDDEVGATRAQRWLQEATARQRLIESLTKNTTGELLARFQEEVGSFDLAFAEISRDLREARAHERRLNLALEEIDALKPPEVAAASGEVVAGLAALAQAERAVMLGESAVSYREARLQALRKLKGLIDETADPVADQRGSLATALEQSVSLAVLAKLLQERAQTETIRLPAEVSGERYAERLERLREARSDLAEFEGRLAALKTEIDDSIQEALAALNDVRRTMADNFNTLQREQDWSAFVDELRGLDQPEIIRNFEESTRAYAERLGALADIARDTRQFEAKISAAEEALAANVDPTLLSIQDRDQSFAAWLKDQGLTITEAESTSEAQPTGSETAATAATTAEEAEPDQPELTQAEQWLSEERNLRDGFVIRRQSFYEANRDLRQALRAELTAARSTLEKQQQQAQQVLDDARRAWGAAAILSARVLRGDMDESDLPAEVENWHNREALENARDIVNQISVKKTQIDKRLADTEHLERLDTLIAPLKTWQGNLNAKTEALRDYLSFEAQFASVADLENMDPIEKQLITAEINTRIATDLGVYDALDDFFASAEMETIDDILNRYYERLVVSERRLENLDSRQATLESLIAQSQENRPVFEALQTELATFVGASNTALAVETALVRAALDPTNSADILGAASERTGIEISADDVPELPLGLDDEALREHNNALIVSLNDDWARAHSYGNWLQQVQAMLEPLGGIDIKVEGYRDLSARLAAVQNDIGRTINRLTGYSPNELQQLAFDDNVSQQRAAIGEIGALKTQREATIKTNAFRSLIYLVLIPIIALLIIFTLRMLGRRYVNSAQKSGGPSAELRAQTINGVLQTVATSVIIGVSIIYMLKSINIDVTTLLASLGFLGLAVAFGAQNLMKDTFSGFFLLLENQFSAGEWVKLNGEIFGKVEKVGMRMTTFRDFFNGSVHHVPNGYIEVVSNYNREWSRRMLWIHVPFSADIDQVRQILDESAEELQQVEEFKEFFHAYALMPGIGDFDYEIGAMKFRVNLDAKRFMVDPMSATYFGIVKRRLDKAGIPLAITQRKIVSDDDLSGASGQRSALGRLEAIADPGGLP